MIKVSFIGGPLNGRRISWPTDEAPDYLLYESPLEPLMVPVRYERVGFDGETYTFRDERE